MTELLTQAQLAVKLSLTKARISQLVKEGRLNKALVTDPLTQRRLFDLTTVQKILAKKIDEKPLVIEEIAQEANNAPESEDEPDVDLNQERALKTHYEAKLAKIEYRKATSELIEARRVGAVAFEIAAAVRESLLALPSGVASELAALTDSSEIESVLMDRIEVINQKLIENIKNIENHTTVDEDVEDDEPESDSESNA